MADVMCLVDRDAADISLIVLGDSGSFVLGNGDVLVEECFVVGQPCLFYSFGESTAGNLAAVSALVLFDQWIDWFGLFDVWVRGAEKAGRQA